MPIRVKAKGNQPKAQKPKKAATKTVKKLPNPNIVEAGKATQFKSGNKAAEKWTAEDFVERLNKMYEVLIRPPFHQRKYEETNPEEYAELTANPITANRIKFLYELVEHKDTGEDFTTGIYDHLAERFKDNEAVTGIIKRIKRICEIRLSYGNTPMEIFLLKNHYGYRDSRDLDMTTKGKEINNGVAVIAALPDSITYEQLLALSGRNED